MKAVLTVRVPAKLDPAQRSELIARLRALLGSLQCRLEVQCDPDSWRAEAEGLGAPELERPDILARVEIEVRRYLRALGAYPVCRGDLKAPPDPEPSYLLFLLLLRAQGRAGDRYAEYCVATGVLHIYRPLAHQEASRLREVLASTYNRQRVLEVVDEIHARQYGDAPPSARELEDILAEVYAVVGEYPEVIVWGNKDLMNLDVEYLVGGVS